MRGERGERERRREERGVSPASPRTSVFRGTFLRRVPSFSSCH
jgi:hypothetical protein